MERVIFATGEQHSFLEKVRRASGATFNELTTLCKKHPRTINNWCHEKTSMPYYAAVIFSKTYSVPMPPSFEIKPRFWYTKRAGAIGAQMRYALYGNPGTKEGRIKGGMRSLSTHRKLHTAFKQRKRTLIPPKSAALAECVGIILGDGSIAKYHVGITLNNTTDGLYSIYIEKLIKKLFGIGVTKKIYDVRTLQITVTGINVVEYLLKLGLKRGDKLKSQVTIPNWIKSKPSYLRACIKGLVDTDGCVYIDTHKYKTKIYKNICLAFTSYSTILLHDVYIALSGLDLQPKKYFRSIKIRKEKNVKKYFQIIGSSNKKHEEKFIRFMNYRGEVA